MFSIQFSHSLSIYLRFVCCNHGAMVAKVVGGRGSTRFNVAANICWNKHRKRLVVVDVPRQSFCSLNPIQDPSKIDRRAGSDKVLRQLGPTTGSSKGLACARAPAKLEQQSGSRGKCS